MSNKIFEKFLKSFLSLTVFFLIFANSFNVNAQKSSTKITREKLEEEFIITVDCSYLSKCFKTMSRKQMRSWILNNPARKLGDRYKDDHRGFQSLDYDDFVGFQKVYGNALAKHFTVKARDENGEPNGFIKGFKYNDDSDTVIVVERDPLAFYNGQPINKKSRFDAKIDDFVEDFYEMFPKKGSGISQTKFVNYMISKQ